MASESPVPDVSPSERAFYIDEFRGATIVVALVDTDELVRQAAGASAASLAVGGSRLVLVASTDVDLLAGALPVEPLRLEAPSDHPDDRWWADLWLAVTDRSEVLVRCAPGTEVETAARLAVALRALKLVLTDPAGGWGRPPRSFADVVTHAGVFEAQLASRQGGALVAALRTALAGGVANVNVCRPADLERELFTYDGTGTLFTSGGYVDVSPLRVDDLPAVELLVAQGVADGLLRPRDRREIARLAVSGLGARVAGSGHLAGLVSLDVDRYQDQKVGEVSCLYTVGRLSGAGAGAVLMQGLVDRATELGLQSVFAVTVSEVAAAFFARRGFVEVDPAVIPDVKWVGYDPERRRQARAFSMDIVSTGQESMGF